MLKITHLSHACFQIENGMETVLIDPSDPKLGYQWDPLEIQYLLISHAHWDHNYTEPITVTENKNTFSIRTIESYHDKEKGMLRGPNIIHVIESEEIKICHLGDLGDILTKDQCNQIGNVDVLCIPVGGVYTINYQEAMEVITQLHPKIIIPMHYQTKYWGEDKGIDEITPFLQYVKGYNISQPGTNHIFVDRLENKVVYVI